MVDIAQLKDLIVNGVGRFIGKVYASEFIGKLTGNADTATSATKATQDESGNNIKSSYASSISISDHTITLKNKNGNSLGTVTVPDNNTWRPLGTTADTACAGNDSRLSNARPASDVYSWAKASSKPSYSWSEITSKPSTFTPASHTHNYAGSSSPGGSANSSVIPYGFNNRGGNATWGNQTGTYVTDWNDSTGGSIQFRRDNPVSGELSALIDGYFYQREGHYRCLDTSDSSSFASSSHTHNYAGSSSAGGSATSAVKLDSSAGSATQPVYFSGGKPVACTYSLNKTVPSDAKFTDTNTWRGIQNNLTSDSTTDSLSAAQGKVLKGLVDGKAASSHTHNYLPLSGGTVTGATQFNNYLQLNAWSGYGTGTANFWYDANNKFVEIQNANDLKLGGTKVSKEGHTHNYLPLSGGTVNGAITFGKNDNYGIFTSTNNYCSIGSSSAYFYRAYINHIYLESLSFKNVNSNLDDNTRKSIFRSGFKDEVINGCAPNSSGIIDLGAKCTALNSTNGGGHHVVCCFMANPSESLVGRAVAYRGNGCNWYCRLTNATDDSPASGWSNVSIFVLYTNW